MDSGKLISNVFGSTENTMSFLEKWGFSTQSAESAMHGAIRFLENCGFSSTPPEKLYHYRPPKHVAKEINQQYLHYSPVTSMTDPYDCLLSSKRILKKIGLWEDNEEEIVDEELERIITDLIRERINICCFSESFESFAMWDQYAAGHRGVCIEYDSKKLLRKNISPMKVRYSARSFKKFNNGSEDITEYLLGHLIGCTLTKNIEYKHEREWRSFGVNEQNVPIGDAINCVFIGSKCSKGRNKIIQACRDQGIDLVRMSVRDEEYSFIQRRHEYSRNH